MEWFFSRHSIFFVIGIPLFHFFHSLNSTFPFSACFWKIKPSTIPFFHSISRFFRSTFLIFRKNKIPLIFLAFNVLYPNFAHEFNRGLLQSRRKNAAPARSEDE